MKRCLEPACNETEGEEDNGGGFCMKFKEFDKPEYFVKQRAELDQI